MERPTAKLPADEDARPPSPPRTPSVKESLPGKRRSIVQSIKASFSRASLVRTVSASSAVPKSNSPSPVPAPEERDPRHIYEAQSSAYWTGRFTALSDQHLAGATAALSFAPPGTPPSSPVDNREPLPRALLRLFSREDAARLEAALDEEGRARAVFAELEGLCRTGEARTSLREWREGWAARFRRPGVLPREQRGFLDRLRFGREQ